MLKNNSIRKLTLGFFLLATFAAFSQQKVTGKITDGSTGGGIPGVTILLKGTALGTFTDFDGNYTIKTKKLNDVIIFSYLGYKTQEVTVNGKTNINIKLIEDEAVLDEIVIVGYGSQKRSSLTGAVAKLENKNLDNIAVSDVSLAIIGQLPGLSVRQGSSRPGDSPQISIRGTSSITGSNDPLVVIDGFPTEGGLSTVNSGDIESIEVLKDASSAAIYGSRAAGGVIIITTKSGDNKKPSFSFNTYTGLKNAINLYDDVLNSEETYQYSLKRLETSWIQNGGDPNTPISDRPVNYQPDELKRDFADTDWQNEVLKTAVIQNYEFSVKGGNSMLNYYVSGNYMDDESVFLVGNFKRYSLRANLTTSFNKKLKFGTNIYAAKTDQRRNSMRMREAIKYPSYIPVFLPDGEISPLGSNYAYNRYLFNDNTSQVNPVAKSLGTFNEYKRITVQANTYLKYNIIEGLDFKTSLGVRYDNTKNPYFRTIDAHKNGQVEADFDYSDRLNILNENILTYNKTFAKVHDFDVLLGASYQKQKDFSLSMETLSGSIPDDKIRTLNAGVISDGSTFEQEWGLISYFGRLNYAFSNKYFLSLAYRTDGSSKFGEDNRWGTFPSVSAGWRLDQEKFLSSVSAISMMKIRLSYGLTGRTPRGYYEHVARVQNLAYTLGSGNGALVNGATQGTFGNTELSWEKTKEYNFGFDLRLFKGRINFTADLYKRQTTDLLLENPIPAITGFNTTATNVGQVNNKGIELSLHTRNLDGDFKWDTKINFTRNVNKVADLGGLEQLPLSQAQKGLWFMTKVGDPIGQYFGWHQQGVWKNQEEIDNNPSFPGASPGSIRIADLNGDGEIDADDRAVLGNYLPDFEFGFINEFRYKNLDLSILINGVIGGEIYNFEADYYRSNRLYFTDNQWFSPEDPGNGEIIGNTNGAKLGSTDYYIEDGSYWGARNITLGYSLSPEGSGKSFFDTLRLYISVQNAFYITSNDFKGYNPEGITDSAGSLTTRGVNYGSEPLNRTISLGLNLNF
ncbi:MAG: TonB-linked SusC/RagA family outer membrane protein [Psychroserpens sp.]|jgi:TonB-linked SusC/RagA family outer membrane protein